MIAVRDGIEIPCASPEIVPLIIELVKTAFPYALGSIAIRDVQEL
jgi:hypothetical protein